MKKCFRYFLASFLVLAMVLSPLCNLKITNAKSTNAKSGTTYYVSESEGNDTNDGTSPETPWKTLKKVSQYTYKAGDQILLRKGDVFKDMLMISKSSGTKENPIVLSSYGEGEERPKIYRDGLATQECAVINDAGGWVVSDLEMGFAGIGLSFYYNDTYGHESLVIKDCYFHDINGINQLNPIRDERGYSYSAAIAIGGTAATPQGNNTPTDYIMINDILIEDCVARDAGSLLINSGISGYAELPGYWINRSNLVIRDCVGTENAIYGIAITETLGGYMEDCIFTYNGSKPISVGSTAMMLGNLIDFTVKDCEFAYQQRYGSDPDGCGIDFECRVYDCVLKDNYIHDNAGVGLMFYDNGRGLYNNNCLIEDNIWYNNNQNPDRPSGYEIYSNVKGSSENMMIRDNVYYEMPGITFTNTLADTAVVKDNIVKPMPSVDGEVLKEWTFDRELEGWHSAELSSVNPDGCMQGTIVGEDPYIFSPNNLGVSAEDCDKITISMKNQTAGKRAKLYFITNTDFEWNEEKSIEFPIQANTTDFIDYIVKTEEIKNWAGVIKRIRLDVVNDLEHVTEPAGKFYITNLSMEQEKVLKGWEFNNPGDTEGWVEKNALEPLKVYDGSLHCKATGLDAYMHSGDNLGVNLDEATHIITRRNNPSNNPDFSYYFTTNEMQVWGGAPNAQDRRHTVGLENFSEMREFVTPMSDLAAWTGSLKQLRIDPMEHDAGDTAEIDYVRIVSQETLKNWDFNDDLQGWESRNHLENFTQEVVTSISPIQIVDGSLHGTIVARNAELLSADDLGITLDEDTIVRIKMCNLSEGGKVKLAFITESDLEWDREKCIMFHVDRSGESFEYVIQLGVLQQCKGNLKQLKLQLDPTLSTGSFAIESITIESMEED